MERQHFEDELEQLRRRLLQMGGLVEAQLHKALRALLQRDEDAALGVAGADREVDELQMEIDERCLRLLATQGPLATDLRLIIAVMKINADLERMGDKAVTLVQNALKLVREPPLEPVAEIRRMADLAGAMARDALDAFVRTDPELARDVLLRDDEVDALRDRTFRVLLARMTEDPRIIERAFSLVLISRNLERIADHATNIAEDVIFIADARDVRHHHDDAEWKR